MISITVIMIAAMTTNDSKSGDGNDGVETTDDGREKEQHDDDNVDEYHDGEDQTRTSE